MPGLTEEDRRVWRYVFIYPTRRSTSIPTRSGSGGSARRPAAPRATCAALPRARALGLRTALVQRAEPQGQQLVGDEDVDLVENSRPGSRRAASARARCRGARRRWAGSPTGSAPTSRDERVSERSRASPPSAARASASSPPPSSGSRATASTTCGSPAIAMDAGRLDLARPLPLRDPRGAARRGARVLLRARRRRAHRRGGGRRAEPHAAGWRAMIDQCLPYPGQLERDWMLWVELWLRAARHPELRPTAARLYARMRSGSPRRSRRASEAGEFHASADPERGRRPRAGAVRRLRRARVARRPGDRACPRGGLGRGRSRARSGCGLTGWHAEHSPPPR